MSSPLASNSSLNRTMLFAGLDFNALRNNALRSVNGKSITLRPSIQSRSKM